MFDHRKAHFDLLVFERHRKSNHNTGRFFITGDQVEIENHSLPSSISPLLPLFPGPLHWVLQVPSIPFCTAALDWLMTVTMMIMAWQTLCWLRLSLGSGGSNHIFPSPCPSPWCRRIWFPSVFPFPSSLYGWHTVHRLVGNSREPMGCNVSCRLEMNIINGNKVWNNWYKNK